MSEEAGETGRFGTIVPDMVAGVSVALVLIPQSMAYADLAGMPPVHGLYAAATAPVLAAPFVSSRYLQTGPVALTCLLTFGALATVAVPYSPEYVGLAAILALIVGVVRLLIGVLKLGALAWLMSQPVLRGFTLAAALLIAGSQLPAALGATATGDHVLARATSVLASPGDWTLGSLVLTLLTITLMRTGKRIHPLFPGVLVATVIGLTASVVGLPVGPEIGEIPGRLPPITLDLPWTSLLSLLVPGLVIAVVGFAEPAAIARTLASEDGEGWDPDREFVSQGVANLAAGVFSGFPMGGSFSRSALSKVAGARSWKAGAVSGAVVLAVLPFAGTLAVLPKAILGATVLGAVIKLLDPRALVVMWGHSKPQAALGWVTFFATLLSAPHVEYGVIVGVSVALSVHLWREMSMEVPHEFEEGTLTLRPAGVLWFGSAAALEHQWLEALSEHPESARLVLDLGGLGRIDYSGAEVLAGLVAEARLADLSVTLVGVPPQSERILTRFESLIGGE